MAKVEHAGVVTGFRQNRHRQDQHQTIVRVEGSEDPRTLVGSRVVWRRDDGFQIRGTVAAHHGNGRAVRVRWSRGFPPQAIGSRVTILAAQTGSPATATPEPPRARKPRAARRGRTGTEGRTTAARRTG